MPLTYWTVCSASGDRTPAILHGRNRNPFILHRQNRTLPILCKIKVSAEAHIELLERLRSILPDEVSVVFLGDGEYDSVELQSYLAGLLWDYVCRTAKSTLLVVEGEQIRLDDVDLCPGLRLSLPGASFTQQG